MLGNPTPPKGAGAPFAPPAVTVTTTTATALGVIPIPAGCVCAYRVVIVGDEGNGASGHAFVYTVTARRVAPAGAPALVGTPSALSSHRDVSGSAVTFTAVANGIQVNFSGINGRTIVVRFFSYQEAWQ